MAYPMYGNYMQQSNPYAQYSALQDQLNKIQPQQPMQTTTQQPTSNINWVFVSNEQQARDYAVVPNATMWFMSSENSEIYAKACDQMGMTNFKAFTITEKQTKKEEPIQNVDYVPRSEFDELKSEIESYKQMFLSQPNNVETKKGGNK